MSYRVQFVYQGANVDLHVWDEGENTATIASFFSKFKKHGAGRKVMERTLEYADAMGLDVVLEVDPFGDGPKMTADELRAFYMTFGFQMMGDNVMERKADGRSRKSENVFVRECSE